MDARTVVRLRADASLDANFDATDMRRDGEPLPFKALGPVKVGNHAVIEMIPLFQSDKVEPVATIRITTPVVSVISA